MENSSCRGISFNQLNFHTYTIRIYHKCESGIEKTIPRIIIWHHKAFRVMTNSDPEGQIFLSHPHTNNRLLFLLAIKFSQKFLDMLSMGSSVRNMFLKGYPLEAKNASKNWNQSVHIFWATLSSFGHLGLISSRAPLIVSKFHNETHDPKWQENKIYTICLRWFANSKATYQPAHPQS